MITEYVRYTLKRNTPLPETNFRMEKTHTTKLKKLKNSKTLDLGVFVQ